MRPPVSLLVLLIASCQRGPQRSQSEASPAEPVVANVGQSTITTRELSQLLARQPPAVRAHYGSLVRKKDFLENEIRLELMASEAQRRGYDRDADFKRAVKQQLVSTFLQKEIEAKLKPEDISDAEVQNYYREHINEFVQRELVRVSHIVTKDRRKAQEALRKLRALRSDDVASFARLVSDTSEDVQSRTRGGDMGFIERENGPHPQQLVEAAFKLQKPGEAAGPVQTAQGFHILRLIERRPGITRTYDDAKADIRQRLYQQGRAQQMDKLLTAIKQHTKVEVFEAELANLTAEGSTAH